MPLSTLLSGVYFSFACFSSRKRRRGAMNRLGNRVKCYFIKLCFPHSQSYSTFYSYKEVTFILSIFWISFAFQVYNQLNGGTKKQESGKMTIFVSTTNANERECYERSIWLTGGIMRYDLINCLSLSSFFSRHFHEGFLWKNLF